MITVVQGYAGKRNRAVLAIAEIAGMSAMIRNKKTLVLQLIDNDTNCVEQFMLPRESNRIVGGEKQVIPSIGIDALINDVTSRRLMKDDFDKSCTAMMKVENLLDVAAVSKSNKFTSILIDRLDGIENIIQSAKEVYDNIFILCPTGNALITEKINNLADKSIYCLLQGRKFRRDEVYGKNVSYLVMDFESESSQTLNAMRKYFNKEKPRMFKIEHNVKCNDASSVGMLLQFIRDNCKCDTSDRNYDWMMDIKRIVAFLLDDKETRYIEEEDWEDFPVQLLLSTEFEHLDILEVPNNESNVTKGLFGRRKYYGLKPITTAQRVKLETTKISQPKDEFYIEDLEDDSESVQHETEQIYQQNTIPITEPIENPIFVNGPQAILEPEPQSQPVVEIERQPVEQPVQTQHYEKVEEFIAPPPMQQMQQNIKQQYVRTEEQVVQPEEVFPTKRYEESDTGEEFSAYEKVEAPNEIMATCAKKSDKQPECDFVPEQNVVEEAVPVEKERKCEIAEPVNYKERPLSNGYMSVEEARAELEKMEKIPETPEEDEDYIDLSEDDDVSELEEEMDEEDSLYENTEYDSETVNTFEEYPEECMDSEVEDAELDVDMEIAEKVSGNQAEEHNAQESAVEMVLMQRKKFIKDDFGKIIRVEIVEEMVPLESLL